MNSINGFGKYWSSLSPIQKKHLAKTAKTKYNYLSQIANGHRDAGKIVAHNLSKADENICFHWFVPEEEADDELMQSTG